MKNKTYMYLLLSIRHLAIRLDGSALPPLAIEWLATDYEESDCISIEEFLKRSKIKFEFIPCAECPIEEDSVMVIED